MTKQEMQKIAAVITAAYNGKTFQTAEALRIWYGYLGGYDYSEVSQSVGTYIATNKFPPTIADILQGIPAEREDLEEGEAWAQVMRAIKNSTYHAQEEFDRLPKLVQKAVGSAGNLRDMATAENFNTGVESSNFKRAYRNLKERQKVEAPLARIKEALDGRRAKELENK